MKFVKKVALFLLGLIEDDDKLLMVKVFSRTVTSAVIFILMLIGAVVTGWAAEVVEALFPGAGVIVFILNAGSVILTTIDVAWLIHQAIKIFEKQKDE